MARAAIKCSECPTIIENPTPRQFRCSECAKKRNKEIAKDYQNKRAEARRQRTKEEKAEETKKPEVKKDIWDLSGKSANLIEAEARAFRLSYGVYVSYIKTGMIERHCRDMKVDAEKTIAQVGKDFLKMQQEKKKQISVGKKSTVGTAPRI